VTLTLKGHPKVIQKVTILKPIYDFL